MTADEEREYLERVLAGQAKPTLRPAAIRGGSRNSIFRPPTANTEHARRYS
jgi:hypothetical protein